jgi:hypothetical protein
MTIQIAGDAGRLMVHVMEEDAGDFFGQIMGGCGTHTVHPDARTQ